MSDVVIKAEGLGKKYTIGHQAENGSYLALRDVLMENARGLWRKTRDLARGKPLIVGDTHEEMWALRDVSFEIRRGETVGIIGRNGAGKSTLLKVLSRITEPSAGRVTIKGRVASLLEVGTGFHPELTGRENIYLNGAILGMTRAEIKRKFDEIVAFAEVERFLDTPVKRYSSGMYVRLAFAVAAHLEPEILVVDEVLAVGDVAFQKKSLGKMGDVAKEGRTVLFVSHNMPSIQTLCERVILMEDGRLHKSGEPSDVIQYYLDRGSQEVTAEAKLASHPGRSHSREPALKRVWLENDNGARCHTCLMGQAVNIHFEFCCEKPVKNPGFGFGIEDQHGRRIFSLNNYMAPTRNNTLPSIEAGIASFCIPRLLLMPGKYFISIALTEDQTEWVDFVEQALSFQVEAADVYGSGKLPSSTQGIIVIDGMVSIRCLNNESNGE